MKVGILTYHHAMNYGAYWQACFLCNRLNMEEDIEAEIIDFHMKKEDEIYDYTNWPLYLKVLRYPKYRYRIKMREFFLKALDDKCMIKSKECCVSDSQEEFQRFVKGKYDVIIAGSDEIWKVDSFRGFPTPYWLDGKLGSYKFSYAASSRVDFTKLSSLDQKEIKRLLDDFTYITVRDGITYNQIIKIVDDKSKVQRMCDPSFLWDYKITKKRVTDLIEGNKKLDPDKKNVLVMVDEKKVAKKIYTKLNRKYNLISVYSWHDNYYNVLVSPKKWLELIANVDFVITSFFHGTCFSLVYDTPFLAIGTLNKASKIRELFDGQEELRKHYIEYSKGDNIDFEYWVKELMVPVSFESYVYKERECFEKFLNELKSIMVK